MKYHDNLQNPRKKIMKKTRKKKQGKPNNNKEK